MGHQSQDVQLGYSQTRVDGKQMTAYNPQAAMEICTRVANGETLREICTKESGLVSAHTFQKWCKVFPDVMRAYSSARQLSAQAFEEKALDLAGELARGTQTAQEIRAREVAMGQWRWSASRRDPANYGEKAPVNMIVPVQIITSLDLSGNVGGKEEGTGADPYSLTFPPPEDEIVIPEGELKALPPPASSQADADGRGELVLPPTTKHPPSPFIKRYDPRAPRRRVLTPRIPMDAETPPRKRPQPKPKET